MKITQTALQLDATHWAAQRHSVTESLTVQRPSAAALSPAPEASTVTLSPAGQANAAEEGDQAKVPPTLSLLREVIEQLTGRRIRVYGDDASGHDEEARLRAEAPPSGGGNAPAMTYRRSEVYAESERTSFSAQGTVRTADGREIAFQLQVTLSRQFEMRSDTELTIGGAARTRDPLVLQFGGMAGELADTRFSFDLDADGTSEAVQGLAAGQAFLVFDRNGDGQIGNGSELFGPRSGDGFAELATLDDDGNGWIDESDAAYGKLGTWTPDAQGKGAWQSLAAAGVGALSVSRVATPFAIKDSANAMLGQVQSSGVFLKESGEAGLMQQIDLRA